MASERLELGEKQSELGGRSQRGWSGESNEKVRDDKDAEKKTSSRYPRPRPQRLRCVFVVADAETDPEEQ